MILSAQDTSNRDELNPKEQSPMIKISKNGVTFQKDIALFTARDFYFFLKNIDELDGHVIRLRENCDNSLQVQINQNVYTIWQEVEYEYEE